MKMLKSYVLALAACAMLFASCSEDDDKPTKGAGGGEIDSQSDLVVDDLRGEITGDITLAADKNWILTGPLVVAGGGKLTIEPGTTIKAKAGGTNVYIAVERNAEIQAVGTAALPIRITSNAATPAAGNWGGLLIMGNAKISAVAGALGATAVTEVVDFIYGDNPADDADDSGDIAYLILEYTGAQINSEKEFNGLTLYGVGSGTSISNVAIMNGDDDGIEIFGGSVNVSNILVVNATDDMFDWTQGYRGTMTNLYGIREAGYTDVSADPRGVEADGNLDGLTPTMVPQSDVTITNITIVQNATVDPDGAGTVHTSCMGDVFKIRRGSKCTISNAHVVLGTDVPEPADFVDYTDGLGDAAASSTINLTAVGGTIDDSDVKPGANNTLGNITRPGVANTGCASTVFAWTGYTF
jgi:hypothetical protein